MSYNFIPVKTRLSDIGEWLSREYSGIRTGRATPALLDAVRVESYGTKVPLQQVGSVSVEDPRTLRLSPWDASQVKTIEKALIDADLGVSVSTDDRGLRVSFPELTAERRQQLVKLVKSKLEEARVSIREVREKIRGEFQSKEKSGEISKDDRFRYEEELQKLIDSANKNLDTLFDKKEQEIAG